MYKSVFTEGGKLRTGNGRKQEQFVEMKNNKTTWYFNTDTFIKENIKRNNTVDLLQLHIHQINTQQMFSLANKNLLGMEDRA